MSDRTLLASEAENAGPDWGDDGYYLIAPEVIAAPTSLDFWVVTGSWEPVHR